MTRPRVRTAGGPRPRPPFRPAPKREARPEAPLAAPRQQRRSLSHVGGEVATEGSRPEAQALARALAVEPHDASEERPQGDDGEDRAHVHGFHTYPARMHPRTAAFLVSAFAPFGPGAVLDPFCGSGTVLVEAQLAGRTPVGTDLNPLAVRLAAAKVKPRAEGELAAIVKQARRVAAFAEDRRQARAGASHRLPDEDVALFDPHVLLELDGLATGIRQATPPPLAPDLWLVLSAILVKLSRKRADTAEASRGPRREAPKRIAAGYPSKLFVKKADELARRIAERDALLPRPVPPATVRLDDATRLATVPDDSVDCVITSPPYAGTYDYLAHHAMRIRWLGLDARDLEAKELGARRRYRALPAKDVRRVWQEEITAFLGALERVTRRGAFVVLLMADSAVGAEALRADELVATAAAPTRLECVARASQTRPHFHGETVHLFRDVPRSEHALLLRRR